MITHNLSVCVCVIVGLEIKRNRTLELHMAPLYTVQYITFNLALFIQKIVTQNVNLQSLTLSSVEHYIYI